MLALRHPLILISRIAHHQGAYDFLLIGYAYEVQQGLIACDTTALDKACDGGAQANGGSEKLRVGLALLSVGNAGDV